MKLKNILEAHKGFAWGCAANGVQESLKGMPQTDERCMSSRVCHKNKKYVWRFMKCIYTKPECIVKKTIFEILVV